MNFCHALPYPILNVMRYFYARIQKTGPWACVWFWLFFAPNALYAQRSGPVTGRVADEANQPLSGVTVAVKGTTVGSITDAKGEYSVNAPAGSVVLVFSYIGYVTEEVPLNGQTTVNVTLLPDLKSLSEVVVVGYGTVKKSDLTGSVSSVKAAELTQTPIANLVQGLQGRAAGVQITQNSGAPGGNISIRIRGNNSLTGSNEPLYVIDGIPIGSGGDVARGGVGFGNTAGNVQNPLSSLNPSDIESIEILKDASATSIYGTRGANGVVLVTTKRGKAGKTSITYDAYYGIQQVGRKLEMMNATEFARMENEIIGNTSLYPNPDSLGTGTDWQDLIFRTAPIQSHQISVLGGNDKTVFNVSANYFRQDGIVIGSDFTRGSIRLNLDNTVNNRLKVGVNFTTTFTLNNGTVSSTVGEGASNGIIVSALFAPPTLTPYDELGKPILFGNSFGGRYLDYNNPLAFESQVLNRNTGLRLLGNVYADVKIAEGLTYRATLGGDIGNSIRDSYVGRGIRAGQLVNGQGGKGQVNNYNVIHESILNYDKTFGESHKLALTGVFSTQSQTSVVSNTTTEQFPNDILLNNNLGLAATVLVGSNKSRWRLDSYTARANYSFRSKYLVTLTGRVDGSTRFGENNKYGFFPSVALGWRISEESFLKDVPFLSDLKLRGSYGVTGNAEIPLYQSLTQFSANGNYNFNNSRNIGIGPDNIPNPDLRWEKSYQTNVGVDVGLINNRITVSADYYVKKTNDLLLRRDIPLSSGQASVLGNFGSIENRGIEITANAAILTGEFKWTLGGNFTANRNKVLKIDDSRTEIVPTFQAGAGNGIAQFTYGSILRVGQPVGSFYGYLFDGIYQSNEATPQIAGTVRYKDINNDGQVTGADLTIIGDPNPDFIFGVSSNFSYKGFDLSAFVQGVQGNDIYFASRLLLESGQGTRNQLRSYTQRWTPTNPSNTYPKAVANQRLNQSDQFIEDGSFVRIKNVQVGYTLPVSKLNLTWLQNLRVYVSGNNLFTFTRYTGYDPEVNTAGENTLQYGVDNTGYPVARSYLLGLQVTF